MLLLIFLIALLFTTTAFIVTLPVSSSSHSFITFLLYQIQIILGHSVLFCILSIFIIIALVRVIQYEKTHSLHKKSFITFAHLVTVVIIGIFTSYLFLLVIAWIQLTSFAILLNTNQKAIGVTTEKKELIATLKDDNTPPQIIATEDSSYDKLISITKARAGTEYFYGSMILPSIPSFLLPPVKNLPPSILVDNTLIIANVNKTELETLSPIVGYMFIKHYFPERKIKFYPTIINNRVK